MARNIFNSVKLPKVGSNRFNLSHDRKFSGKMGWLMPTCVMEAVPGDKFRISVENMLRFAPLIAPVMHRVNVTTHYFFVPNRLLWLEWEDWITGNSDSQHPYLDIEYTEDEPIGSLGDYLGYNWPAIIGPGTPLRVSALPVAAYCKIWDEYYRDQNLQAERFQLLGAGDNDSVYLDILNGEPFRRAWMHDYFTSALPFAQKGDAVQIPLTFQEDIPIQRVDGQQPNVVEATGGAPLPGSIAGAAISGNLIGGGSTDPASLDLSDSHFVDIQSDATSINDLRRAFRLQEWLERNARGGTRYIENILAHFGVRSSDARLQRPEYIGGAFQNMVISEVLSTAQTNTTVGEAEIPVGYMGGHGISVGGGKSFHYRAEEHGFIIGIMNVQPVTAYQQGLPRMFSRFDRLDYFWPSFANIGEQEVKLKELWMGIVDNTSEYDSTFGYVPRYSEYKYMPSTVHGEMKTNLAFWHLGRIFGTTEPDKPVLNESFIECDPSTRIFAVEDEASHHLYCHVFNNISAVRKMPKYGIPTL